MNDDLDPQSSSDSDDSPPPAAANERGIERTISAGSSRGFFSQFTGESLGAHFGGGSSKRRGGLTFGGSSRDTKTRRREDSFGTGLGRRGGPSLPWDQREQGSSLRQKDELVDTQVVETLRTQIGDPFDDRVLQSFK
ncbi:uncharacterized protein B0H18DRAFT_1121919 [Fomitopsis serialis]|uniref:uncharacterized protein n=1 Tax=Fomitopsis serialis TaxID=139415 RepID=UPI002007AD17|nr:uncharacterized protein B0H18DRAFT_1121919 [Neoantrodia serialis]KAH9920454.1 hypothetical protein B0H18DRAFT_1121919 [Neoantrodia serialis]